VNKNIQMNFVKTVLIYSKYSQHCKKLLDTVQNSNVNFLDLQTLCIDNEKIRSRIKSNKLLEISSVPCLLIFYQNGTVEKFESTDCFNWFNMYIKEKTEVPREVQREVPREVQREVPREVQREVPREVQREVPPKTERPKMKKVSVTSVEDISFDNDENDRHRNIPQPKRIREDDSGYIDDDNLFSGEQIELKEASNAIKKQKSTVQDPHGTAAKAKQLAQAREQIETSINPISQRPNDVRRS
jgi:hypothetical protein